MNSKHLLLGLAILAASPTRQVHGQAAPPIHSSAPQPGKKPSATAPAAQPHEDDGQRIFAQNCARCHNAPDGFSSRISGTVVLHMRVRASLSRHDEEMLLRFFNP